MRKLHQKWITFIWGNSGNSIKLYFLGAPKSLQMVIAAMKLKDNVKWGQGPGWGLQGNRPDNPRGSSKLDISIM